MFQIDIERFNWIENDGKDDPDDLCLHGLVKAKIGNEIFCYEATVSAAGLYFLRTLTENHIIRTGENMLPHCGHFMIANEELNAVDILGCDNGIDFSVIHMPDGIHIVTETGEKTIVDKDDYIEEVNQFADKIEACYESCASKNIAGLDEFDRNGYIAFWNEWKRRRA